MAITVNLAHRSRDRTESRGFAVVVKMRITIADPMAQTVASGSVMKLMEIASVAIAPPMLVGMVMTARGILTLSLLWMPL
tara:strand:+ start:174 stop:413 length:240 start_codon:yes stop_codon:yes gene_type:complete